LEDLKRATAERTVESGMVVGLDTGSTVSPAVRELREHIAGGELEGVRGVTTSGRTEALARKVGVPLVAPSEAHDHNRRLR
jgi:ribose 5-phosphate isomerase